MRHQALAKITRNAVGGQRLFYAAALIAILSTLLAPYLVYISKQSSEEQATGKWMLPCGISLLQGRRAQVWHKGSITPGNTPATGSNVPLR